MAAANFTRHTPDDGPLPRSFTRRARHRMVTPMSSEGILRPNELATIEKMGLDTMLFQPHLREMLMSGLPLGLWAAFRTMPEALSQLRADLATLNALPRSDRRQQPAARDLARQRRTPPRGEPPPLIKHLVAITWKAAIERGPRNTLGPLNGDHYYRD